MTLTRKLIAAAVLSTAALSSSAYAAPEPSLPSILNYIEPTTWTEVASFDDLLGASWNTSGTTLNFTLVAEFAGWAPYQTFNIVDGQSSNLIFQGSDTANATKTYTLSDILKGYFFGETAVSEDFLVSKSKIYESTSGLYVFTHEDTTDNDFNDMVVAMKVSAVPEPETYAMMLAGLGFVGFVARKKKAV